MSFTTLDSIKDEIANILRGGLDARGDTALHAAFRKEGSSQAQLIQALKTVLDCTAININVEDKTGKTILHLAVERRMCDVIGFCLERGADPNKRDSNGNTIAHFVIEEECRKFNLLTKKYDAKSFQLEEKKSAAFVAWMEYKEIDFFHQKNQNGYSALYLASELNLQHILLALQKRNDDLLSTEKGQRPLLCAFLDRSGYRCYEGLTPISPNNYGSRHVYEIVAIILQNSRISDKNLAKVLKSVMWRNQSMDVVEILLQHMTSVDFDEVYEALAETFTNRSRDWSDDLEIILLTCVRKGADINKPDKNGVTIAQKVFSHHPKLGVLKLLKKGGVDFGARTNCGESFLHFISEYGNEAGLIDLVASEACDLNVTTCRGQTPLEIAIKFENDVVAMDLIERGAEVNDDHEDARSPLCMACITGQAKLVSKLIECGADLEYRDEYNRPLLHFGVDCPEVVKLLVENGADVDAKDHLGKTALHRTINATVVKILFHAGAFVDVQDKQGVSPLYGSLFHSECMVTEELLKCGAEIPDHTVFFNYLQKHFERRMLLKPSNSKNPIVYMMKHAIKLMAADMTDNVPFEPCVIEYLREFFKQYQKEVESLKTFFIDNSTSLYDLLHKSRTNRCAYVHNKKLKALVEDVSINKKFPSYFVLIVGCYNEAATRKPLLEYAAKGAFAYFPDLCANRILAFLSNWDLDCLIEACQ